MRTDITRVALAVAVVGAGFLIATAALAADADGGQHPAVLRQADVTTLRRGIDPQTFIVAHPARLALPHRHANQEHPAVAQQRAGSAAAIDVNAYRVQPPSPVRWTVGAATTGPAPAVAVAQPR